MTTTQTQTQTPTTGATQAGNTASGLLPKQPDPNQQNNTPYVPQGKPVDTQGKTEEERKREQQEAEAKKKKNQEGDWWDRNKDWLIPLIAALLGGALGVVLTKLIGANNTSAVNAVVSNIDVDKKQEQQVQESGATQTLATAGTQTPADTKVNPQNGTQTPTVTATQGRC